MNKEFSVKFQINAKMLALIYICYKYKFPLSYFLSFYEMFGEKALFMFKAMSCTKRISLNDNAFIKIIEESKLLYKQILTGISTNIKIDKLTRLVKAGNKIKDTIPEAPELNLSVFSDDYKQFIEDYLLKNVVNIFAETHELYMNTNDLYVGISK